MTELAIGTVQFGLDYGISNRTGKVPFADVQRILANARSSSVRYLDTAVAYGDCEAVLGRAGVHGYRVVSKVPSLRAGKLKTEDVASLFENSLQQLGLEKIHGLLIHDAADLLGMDGDSVWRELRRLQERGLVEKIGASVYDGNQIDKLLSRYDVELVQLPINVFDQRLLLGGHLARLKEKQVEVHARSLFLQGLLLMDISELPDAFQPWIHLFEVWHSRLQEAKCSALQACLGFVRDLREIDVVVLGVASVSQFRECLDCFSDAPTFDPCGLACSDEALINPGKWKA